MNDDRPIGEFRTNCRLINSQAECKFSKKVSPIRKLSANVRLKCLYFNARSIVNKLSELELCMDIEKPDILGITETWLTNSILDSELTFEGYTVLRRDRDDDEKSRGGGVLLYIRNELNPIVMSEYKCGKIETLFCNINYNGDYTMLGICYRPPDSPVNSDYEFYSMLNTLDSKNLIIMGDFNFSELDWSSDSSIDRAHSFVECLDNNYLSQLVDKPSRNNNYLDLVLASDTGLVEGITVGDPFQSSDHQMITFYIIASECQRIKKMPVYNYFRADYNVIRQEVAGLKWRELLMCNDVEIIWDKLKSDSLHLRDTHIGRKSKPKNKCKWVTKM